MNKEPAPYKCVTLKGDLEDWGKHLLLPYGITLCGMPTVDVDFIQFPLLKNQNFADMINEYTVEDWDITCEKCLQIISLAETHNEIRKAKNN